MSGAQEASAKVVSDLAALGIDLDEVTAQLEVEGVQKFEASWEQLLGTVSTGLGQVAR